MKVRPTLVTKMNKKILLILSLLLPLAFTAQVVSDAKLWTGVSVSKKYNDFTFSLGEEVRFDENMSHIDKVFTEIEVDYKIIKGLYAGFAYRFARDNDYETTNYDMKRRIGLSLTYKHKYENFRFSFRTKYQRKSALPYENNPTFSRNKLVVKYKMENKLSPFISYEFYYQFNDERVINRARFSFGSSYKINKSNAIKLFYMYENKFNTKNLKHNHVYGISYSLEI
jgi:Protein of unknown function (DUF2490)